MEDTQYIQRPNSEECVRAAKGNKTFICTPVLKTNFETKLYHVRIPPQTMRKKQSKRMRELYQPMHYVTFPLTMAEEQADV